MKFVPDKMYSSTKRNYSYASENFSSNVVRRSATLPAFNSNVQIVSKRGFKPSDRFDPQKKSFLLDLSHKIWKKVFSYMKFLIFLSHFEFYFNFCRMVNSTSQIPLIYKKFSLQPTTPRKLCLERIVSIVIDIKIFAFLILTHNHWPVASIYLLVLLIEFL